MSSESSRRSFLAALGAVPAIAMQRTASAESPRYWTKEYWAQKGDVRLYLFRKRRNAPKSGETPLPVLFLVHGSSLSGRSTFDLEAPGIGDYSMMNAFAGFGFDVWTMDFEGYGRSGRTSGNSNIAEGVKDLDAATNIVMKETGQPRVHLFGESSGGLRVGAFAMAHPDRVGRLVLAAFTYTGQGSPTLADRSKQLDFYRTHNMRPRDRDMIRSIFTRDKVGTADPKVGEALADVELPFGDSVPTGTYLDMTANLPVVVKPSGPSAYAVAVNKVAVSSARELTVSVDTSLATRRWLVEVGCGLIGVVALLDGLWQLWDQPYRQCLHDKWPQTVVVKVPA